MVDLQTSGRRLAEFQLSPATPPESLGRRVRQRRQRRWVAGCVAVVAALAAVTVPLLANRGSGAQNVEVGNSGTSAVVVPHPKGWTPISMGRLELWMPTNRWMTCNYGVNGPIAYEPEGPPGHPCPLGSTGRGAPLIVRSSVAAPPTWPEETINGTSVWMHTAGRATTYDAPALGASITATGSVPNEIAKTLGRSPIGELFTHLRTVISTDRSGYRRVSYDGLSFLTPDSWSVETITKPPGSSAADRNSCFFFTNPMVYLGDDRATCSSATVDDDVPGIWLGPALQEEASVNVTITAQGLLVSDLRMDLSAVCQVAVTIHAAGGNVIHATMSVTNAHVAQQILASFTD